MTDFSLFEEALTKYNENHDKEDDISHIIDKEDCKHNNIIEETGIVCCADCGIEMEKSIFHEKEWRYYGQSDNKRTSDPNRVHLRKIELKLVSFSNDGANIFLNRMC